MKIEAINLEKKFGNKHAVNNISFVIPESETIGLLGPNGCGKTTTIGMMLGLIKPSSGIIKIDNQDINKVERVKILEKVNFASPYIELPKKLTVRQNLEVFGKLYGVENLEKKIIEIAQDLDLRKFLDKKTGELSSGQKNRVSLAKSLLNKPRLLLLDEPTASLDPDIGDFVRSYIDVYKKTNKVTILLASHNMSEVERLCSDILMLKEGKIVDKGSSKFLIKKHGRNNLEETFLKIARGSNEMA
tara:strand:+ start:148 stop:882 length:735 start_codon:yes stop_codon:yes gene_type:complete